MFLAGWKNHEDGSSNGLGTYYAGVMDDGHGKFWNGSHTGIARQACQSRAGGIVG